MLATTNTNIIQIAGHPINLIGLRTFNAVRKRGFKLKVPIELGERATVRNLKFRSKLFYLGCWRPNFARTLSLETHWFTINRAIEPSWRIGINLRWRLAICQPALTLYAVKTPFDVNVFRMVFRSLQTILSATFLSFDLIYALKKKTNVDFHTK